MIKPPEAPIYGLFKAWLVGTLHKKKGLGDLGGLSNSRKIRTVAIATL